MESACPPFAAVVERRLGPRGDAAARGDHDDVPHAVALQENADGQRSAPACTFVPSILQLDDDPLGCGIGSAQHEIGTRFERSDKADVGIDDLDGA